MGNVLVSIVAPVYNVERYLSSFINSVIGQTFTDWELLLVDDGSTDDSGRICDNYARIDERIRVIHKKNGGVSSARNTGMRESKGAWLLLPDADDILIQDALKVLLSYASEDVDLIGAGYIRNVSGKVVPEKRQSFTRIQSVSDYIEEIGIIPQARNTDRYCWNKLFRMSVITEHDIHFDESISYREDILFVYQYLACCTHKVQSVSYEMYVYYMRDSGANISLQRSYTRKSGGLFYAMTKCYDILDQMGVNEVTMHRMRDEILSAYKKVIELIDKAEAGKQEKRLYSRKLRNYIRGWDFCLLEMKSVYHRIKRFFV